MRPYAELSKRAQVSRLRDVAHQALRQYGLRGARLKLLNHDYNTTFQVDTATERFALRINTNSLRSAEMMRAEVAWVADLAATFNDKGPEFPLLPTPMTTETGELLAEVDHLAIGKPLRAVLYRWLDGPTLSENFTKPASFAMGSALRHLHQHARDFKLPVGAGFQPHHTVLFDRAYDLDSHVPELDHPMLREIVDQGNAILARLNQRPAHPIHFDLHSWNVKYHRGRLSVFDFDDAIMGQPIQDAAVAAFYFRWSNPTYEQAFWRGLGISAESEGLTPLDFEFLVMNRAIGMANEQFKLNTAGAQEEAAQYARVCAKRAAHFMKVGRFDPTVAKFEDG
jgi:Ser/Thr protein kinase RdoA (MazF antagonist)